MKLTTNGIGVKSMSIGKSSLSVIGNAAFAEWAKDGMRLYKMTQTGLNPVFTFHLKKGPVPKNYNENTDLRCWMRAWSTEQKRGTLQNFGATEPISVVLDGDGKQLHITMPPLDKCAKVLRPKGNWKVRARLEAMDNQMDLALDRKAELEVQDAALEAATTVPEPALTVVAPQGLIAATLKPTLDLLEAIDLINQHKDILGRALVFSVTEAGKLRAIVEYGG